MLQAAPCRSDSAIRDVPFWQEYHEAHPLGTALENDVRAVLLDKDNRLWAATGAGIRYLDHGEWRTPPGGDIGPVHALCRHRGEIWAGGWNGVYRASVNSVIPQGIMRAPIGLATSRV